MADEVLVTEFRLNDNYSAGVNRMDSATKGFLSSAGGLGRLLPAIGSGIAIAGAAVVGGGAALLGFANAASEAAASFDTMQRTFSGALGSLEAGAQMMKYLEDYATRSAFGLDALAQSSAQLAASGLDVGRFLPIMERFALVASGVDPQGLTQVASALARVKGGSFGEAVEVFRRAGVGTQDLQAQGVKVGKGGEIQATAEQVFNAIQVISEGRLKTIADSISGGAENIRANVSDVAGQAFRQIGAEVNEKLLPILVQFTQGFKDFVEAGGPKLVADAFLNFSFSADSSRNLLVEFGATLIQVNVAARSVVDGIIDIGNSIGAAWDWLNTPLGGGKKDTLGGLDFGAGFNAAFGVDAANEFRDTMTKKFAEIANQTGLTPEAPKAPETKDTPAVQTANNTAKLVNLQQKQLDISRQILGGGDLAANASSPVRLGQALGGNNGGSRVEYHTKQLIRGIIEEVMGTQIAAQRNSATPNRFVTR